MAAGRMSVQSKIMTGFMPTDLGRRRVQSRQPSRKHRLRCDGLQPDPDTAKSLLGSWQSKTGSHKMPLKAVTEPQAT